MIPGINPRDMQRAMKKMGIKQIEIDAIQVIIKCSDREILINNPSVSKVNMMGQETFQISGDIEEKSLQSEPDISGDDISTVAEQANVSKEQAEEAIKKSNGDLAKAILELKQ